MLTPGDVVLALFYYTDYRGAKVRPAIVVSDPEFFGQTGQAILCAASSRPVRNRFEVVIEKWSEAGLRFPSKAQPGKLLTVDAHLVKKIGHLVDRDYENVKSLLRQVIP